MVVTTRKTIVDIEPQVDSTNPIAVHLPENILSNEDYLFIKQVYDITQKYRNPDWVIDMSITEMTSDLLVLQSSLVHIMYRFSTLSSYANNIEDQLKIARSKIRIQAKSVKQDMESNGDSVSITADDIKDLSYAKTEDLNIKLEEHRQASDFIKSMYFSIKDHVQMLNNTIHRISRVEIQ